jgi:ATP-dependent Clp protease ATP-binding subunit ClpA
LPDLSRFTDRTRKVLDGALREALSLGHNYIGTEHLLLALVRDEDETVAYMALQRFASADEIRNEVIRLLSGKDAISDPVPERKALDIAKEIVEKHLADAPEDPSTPVNIPEVITALALVAIAEALGEKPS